MTVNKTKLAKGGEVGEVTGKKTYPEKLKVLFMQHKILFIIGIVAVSISLVAIFANLTNNNSATLGVQPEIQEVNQETVNSALKQLQDDPNSVPSGDFHPELGSGYFRTTTEEGN